MIETLWDDFLIVWDWLMSNLLYINIILSIVIVFFQRRDPRTVWTWLLVLYFIPIVGFFLYLVIGQDMHKSRMFKTKEVEDELSAAIRKQEEIIFKHEFTGLSGELENYSDMVLYNLESSGAVYADDNSVDIFTDGEEKFGALLEDMRQATDYIHIQYYIIRPDELWASIEEVLEEKVKQGVEVRVLYDSMGCRSMRQRDFDRIRGKGIMLAEFFPAFLKKLHLRINYRNHRKIVVIDGKKAYVGGFNIGREYLGRDKKFGYWRDTHLRISGTAVRDLQIRFILDWNYAAKENLFKNDKYLKIQSDGQHKTGIQIISSGPDSKYQNIRNNYLRLIHKAKDHIYIQTPYFIPDEAILNGLKIAAMSGVDVRVMIPCKPDHPFVYWATYSYMNDLIEAGAKCYTYDNGFLHVKGMMTDGLVSCFGTANMDVRSFGLNFEVNAVMYSQETTEELEAVFREDLQKCTAITPYIYANRSVLIRLKEQVSRLLSPLL